MGVASVGLFYYWDWIFVFNISHECQNKVPVAERVFVNEGLVAEESTQRDTVLFGANVAL